MTEREWHEASDLRVSRLGLLGVLIVAAVLRFWALGHGIPYSVGVDEPEIVERAFNMMKSGSLNPNHFFDYPGFYIYVQLAVSCARFMWGALNGEWVALTQATTDGFYLWGRALTAAIGVVTVVLVFRIGLRWGGRHALLAAGLMAVMPLHVYYSHYVLTDTPLTFFVTLTLLLSLVACERNTLAAFAWAGAAAGLAAATKYNGGLAIIMPLVGAWMSPSAQPSRLRCALGICGAALAAFLAAAPYTILDLPAFLNTFGRLAGEYRGHDHLSEAPAITYLKHVKIQLGYPAALLSLAGLTLGIVRSIRGPGRVRWALTVTFPVVYFWMISRQEIVFARYLLPIVPMLCALTAAAVVSGVSLLRRYEIPRAPRTALIAALTIAALPPPSVTAIRSDRDIARRTTVDMAYDWILANVPPGSHVAVESRKLLLPPAYKSDNMAELRRKTYDKFVADGVEYLVASSQSYGRYPAHEFPAEYGDYMRIFGQSKELIRFTPTATTPGPELRVFRVKP